MALRRNTVNNYAFERVSWRQAYISASGKTLERIHVTHGPLPKKVSMARSSRSTHIYSPVKHLQYQTS